METPDLDRPWPVNEDVAIEVDKHLHGGNLGERGSATTTVNMTAFKAEAAIGKRANYPGQKSVMTASATDVSIVRDCFVVLADVHCSWPRPFGLRILSRTASPLMQR